MKKILNTLHERPAHERRRLSLRVATGLTAAVFLIWLTTLGVRFAGGGVVAQEPANTLTASGGNAFSSVLEYAPSFGEDTGAGQ